MDFHIICVGQLMEINGMSSCRQLKPHSLNKSIVNFRSSKRISFKVSAFKRFLEFLISEMFFSIKPITWNL